MFTYKKIAESLGEVINSMVSTIAASSSVTDKEIDFDEPDLSGYTQTKDQTTSGFNPLVPYSPSASHHASYGFRLNVTRLPQTHIDSALRNKYSKEYAIRNPTIEAFGSSIVNVENIVKNLEGNIVAIALGKGEPLGTGILIAPNLVLTARHCVEGCQPSNIAVITNFQEIDNEMDFGTHYKINGVVEEEIDDDYVILELSNNAPCFSPFNINLSTNFSQESVFFHHPAGGPKKISVHENVSSKYMQLAHSSYHDTEKGSSGGVYVNANGTVAALHLLGRATAGLSTHASFLKNIREKSLIIKNLFSCKGDYIGKIPDYTISNQSLTKTDFNYWKERSTRLSVIPAHPTSMLAYHHIIPITDMEFLWMISKENSKLDSLLKSLSCNSPDALDSHGRLTINAAGWMPWNLFVGPNNNLRGANDPGEGIETIKPVTFHEELWNNLMLLNDKIQEAWKIRSAISGNLRDIAKEYFPNRNHQATLGHNLNDALKQRLKMSKETLTKLKREYKDVQFKISNILEKIVTIVRIRPTNYIHNNSQDWLKEENGEYRLITQKDAQYTQIVQERPIPFGYQSTTTPSTLRSIKRTIIGNKR